MISITPDNNILVQPGTYTATGITMDWETGEEYTPSYTLETAKTFYSYETAPAGADFYSFGNTKEEQFTVTSTGCNWQTNGVVLNASGTNRDGDWDYFQYNQLPARNLVPGDIITITMNKITPSGLPEEGALCRIQPKLTWAQYTVGVNMEAKLFDSSGNQIGETSTASYNKSNDSYTLTYAPNFGMVRLYNNENYTIQIVMTMTKTPGTNYAIRLQGYTRTYYTYPAYSCKIGMEYMYEQWILREDYDNIWNLGYINFDEGSVNIPNSWSETPLYNTNLYG